MDETMSGKACLITGGTGGIGLVTARALASRGADVMIVGRSPEAGAAAVAELRRAGAGGTVEFAAADLSRQSEVRRLAAVAADRFGRLDVLVNNAGGMFRRRTLSADGIEMTFALNHLAYFLLSESAAAGAQRRGPGADRQRRLGGAPRRRPAVRRSPVGARLRRRLVASTSARSSPTCSSPTSSPGGSRAGSVSVNALHPGFVATDIGVRNKLLPGWLWRLVSLAAISPEEGAKTSIHVAASREVDGRPRQVLRQVPARPILAAVL